MTHKAKKLKTKFDLEYFGSLQSSDLQLKHLVQFSRQKSNQCSRRAWYQKGSEG